MQQKFVLLERLLVLPQVPHVGAVLSRDVCSWKIPSLPGLPRSCFNMRLENPKCQQTVGQSVKHIQSLNRLSFSFFLLCKLKNGKKFHQLATKPTVILPALPVSDFCIHTQSCLPITQVMLSVRCCCSISYVSLGLNPTESMEKSCCWTGSRKGLLRLLLVWTWHCL